MNITSSIMDSDCSLDLHLGLSGGRVAYMELEASTDGLVLQGHQSPLGSNVGLYKSNLKTSKEEVMFSKLSSPRLVMVMYRCVQQWRKGHSTTKKTENCGALRSTVQRSAVVKSMATSDADSASQTCY